MKFQLLGKRILESLVTLWLVATLCFLLLRFLPGGPFDSERALPEEVQKNIEAKYHLDEPIISQYFIYMKNLTQGDLGVSYKYIDRPITEIVSETLPNSFQLGIMALILALVMGISLGTIASYHHNKWQDYSSMFVAISGISLPSFLVAPFLIYVFSLHFNILPSAFWNGPSFYILPVITLGLRPASVIARLIRSSLLEVLGSDYIRTAKAKGLKTSTVIFKHGFKNALIPVLTYLGPLTAEILSGSFIVELIFSIPGIGRHMIQGVTNRDYPVVLALTLLFAFLLVFANLIVDLLYSFVDKRIQLRKSTP